MLGREFKDTFAHIGQSLRLHLDTGNKALTAEDFRHLTQKSDDQVTELIHMECNFRVVYGWDKLAVETRDMTFGDNTMKSTLCIQKDPHKASPL